MNRKVYYDKLRVLATFLVIGVHSVGSIEAFAEGKLQETVVYALKNLNNLGVPIFFALSGVLILSEEYNDLWGFYKKRLIRVGIPYLVYAAIYVCYFTGYEEKNIIGIPLAYIKNLVTANIHPTHWFVYTILGLYFAAPFLSKMMHAISDKELTILMSGCLLIIILCRVFAHFDLVFGINNVVFNTGNLWMFIGGYSIDRIIRNRVENSAIWKYRTILSAGLIVLYVWTNEILLGQIAVMIAMVDNEQTNKRSNDVMDRITFNFSKYSYSVYLIHAAVISLILRIYRDWNEHYIVKCILIYPVVFIISYGIARTIDFIITDRVINAVTYKYDKAVDSI